MRRGLGAWGWGLGTAFALSVSLTAQVKLPPYTREVLPNGVVVYLAQKPAHHLELVIDTKKNEPRVKLDETCEWGEKPHGTRVEIELEGAYRGGQHSVDAYIRQISLANPHAQITYVPPKAEEHGAEHVFPRVSDEQPPETAEIKPHPQGVELGVLMQMFRDTTSRNLRGCLQADFSRVSGRVADEICERAGVASTRRPHDATREEAEKIHQAIQATKIMAPPTDCIAPIGEGPLERALRSEVAGDFYAVASRRPAVYRGNPFLIEVGLAYGGAMPAEEPITLYRYANRVPLQYQQGACAITKAVTATDWKAYQLQQPRGALPIGPMLLMVHIASVWVPFTSESKEAIAGYPEIQRELRLAMQAVGRKLSMYLRRRQKVKQEGERRNIFLRYLGEVATAVSDIKDINAADRESLYKSLVEVAKRKTATADVEFDENGQAIAEDEQDFGEHVLIVERTAEPEEQGKV